MNAAFVTGASGALGSAIVPLWLAQPNAHLHLLLRADSDAAMRARVDQLLRYWGWQGDAGPVARLHFYRGDACAPQFGLSPGHYEEIVRSCSHIIHCAGAVRMNLPLAQARHAAVGSALMVVELARELQSRQQLQKLEYVSTVGVAGRAPGILRETWQTQPRDFHNTYEQAKAEAEVLIQAAVEVEGLPITVHRPSMVIGDSACGQVIHFQIFYYICEFLSGRLSAGLYPDLGEAGLDLIPVDHVAQAIVSSARLPQMAGQILNLCSGPTHATGLESLRTQVRALYAQHGLHLPAGRKLSRAWFGRALRLAQILLPRRQKRLLAGLSIYLDYLGQPQSFDNTAYRAFCQRHGLPQLHTHDCVQQAIQYYLEHAKTQAATG